MPVSVCTLARGRAAHLANMVTGLVESRHQPAELVIAVLQAEPYTLRSTPFPVRQIVLGDDGLSLAKARNAAAVAASGDLLVFLDVDCIPHPDCLFDYVSAASCATGVFMGEVGYLPKGHGDAVDCDRFESVAVRHSERAGPPRDPLGECRDYRCFWSLTFALSRASWDAIGGFDERYVGYGGEDTDYGRMIARAGMPLWWVRGAKAYHQYHPHHMPPVHHMDSVIANADRFRDKWGEPTMQHWLRAFRLMGLAAPGPDGWRKLRDPDENDLELTRQQADQPFASSARVLELLESRAPTIAAS